MAVKIEGPLLSAIETDPRLWIIYLNKIPKTSTRFVAEIEADPDFIEAIVSCVTSFES